MKQFTFSAQVANNLLTVLQGYSKTIRLLLVMFLTLTVSAEVWGATLTLNNLGSSLSTTSNSTISTTTITATGNNTSSYIINYLQCKKQTNGSSHAMLLAKSTGAFISNKTAMPGNIKSVTVYVLTGAASKTTYHCAFSTTECTSAYTTGSTAVNITGGSSNKYTCTVSNAKYFCISLGNANNGQVYKLDVEYEVDAVSCTTPPTVSAGSSSNVAATTATVSCSGGITSLGSAGCSIESYGFVYGTSSNPTISNSKVQVGTTYTTTGTAFTKELTGLTANTTYYVRPYATNGNGTAYGTQTSFKTLELPKYTVTLDAGSGTCAASVTEASAGDGVTLPTPTLDCGDWEFAGWKTTSAVTTETTTEPTLIPAGAYSPPSDITLYAVYQRTETTSGGGGGGSSTPITTDDIFENGGTYTAANGDVKAYITWTEANVVSIKQEQGSSTSAVNSSYVKDPRWYKSHNITITPTANIAYITVTAQSNAYATELANSTYTNAEASANNSTVTITPTDGNENITISMGAQARLYTLTVTYTSGGGSSSTTYYHSTPDCGSTASTYTLTLDSDLSCVTDGSATVELNATELTNFTPATRDGFTCSGYWSAPSGGVKVLNADGTFAATSVQDYITDGKWTNEGNVTLTPRWECSNTMTLSVGTQSGGTYSLSKTSLETCDCTDTKRQVTITATPNSGYSVTDISYSGNGTATKVSGPTVNGNNTEWVYQFDQGDNGNGTFTVTFTTIPTYTITLDAGSGTCDDESLTETSGGAGVTLPTANPPAACATDGWEFAGWWTASVAGTTTSPGELLTAGSNYKPTSNCTLYAVYSYTEAGGSGGSSEITLLPSSFPDKGTNNYNSGAERTATENDIEFGGHHITGNASNTPSGATQNQYLQCRASDATIYNKTELPGKITQIVVNQYDAKAFSLYCGSTQLMASDNVDRTQTPSGTKITDVSAATTMTWDVDGNYTFFALKKGSNAGYVQSIIITYSGGGSTTTYNSNPICVASWSITYDFAGGTGSHCSNTSVPQGEEYIICEEEPIKEGHTFQGWSDGTNTYAAGAPITPTKNTTLTAQWQINTYTVTWSNNGTPTPVEYNHGVALVVPEAPESCDGVKEFVGWTTHSGYYHATTAPDDIFTTKTTPVTATATYYAVFATPPGTGGGGGGSETTNDVLTRETTGVTNGSTTYASWSGKTATSSAIYAGNSAGGNDAIQLRSNNSNSGIVTTTSGGKVTHVEVDWESNTASDRKLDIYGRNVAYSAATELYSTSTQGTKLGSITCGTSTELEITGDYEYIGLRSNSGAMYLTSVTITWSSAGGSSSYTDYTTICQEVTGIAISGSYPTAFVQYDSFSFAGGIVTATFENGSTQDVTSLATFSGYNMDEVGVQTVTVTYMGQTAKYEITINQSDRWRLTWNVSGKTNTGASPIYVQKGSAIGTLPVPDVPAACAGKTFMGWTESNIVPSDGVGIVYITEETVPTDNTTYYAVFATVNNFSVQKPIEDIESGSNVVIVAVASLDNTGSTGKAISSRPDGENLAGDDVAIFDKSINTPHSTCIWTITKEDEQYFFTQDANTYLNAVNIENPRYLKYTSTKDLWTLLPIDGKPMTYYMQSTNTNNYAEYYHEKFTMHWETNENGDFDMQFFVVAGKGADITDYTTGCEEYTITYYGFHGGYSTSCSSDGTIVLPVNSLHTVPNCGNVVNDHTNLGREFLNVWMTQPHGGHTFKPGDTFILTQDTTLYAQWKMETTSDVTTLPTDVEDLAGTDIYVYGGTTLNIQPGTTTINSLTLKGGLQEDGSYKMPTVWVPEGATLVRNSNKINLDLIVNAKTYYPFAVPFATKNDQYIDYLDPVLNAASTYDDHFVIKTYDGARRATQGEDRANNWVKVLRHQSAEKPSYLQPGVGYIITALTRPDKDTATIRIPMTVPNTWFKNGEQAEVGTTVRNTIAVTAHAGAAATEHQRHAGWNFVANPYLTSFAGGNVANDGGLAYINGELIIEGSYVYGGDSVPYVTVPAYDFAYYSQHKLSEVKLSPEWSFFVQVGTGGTMNFTTAGRQQAPASIAARNAEERPVKMDVDLILSDNHSSDQTGLIICDRYSDAYEIGRDLEKLFGSAYNLSVYTLMEDNTPLAFQALAIRSSMQVIPVGYRAPEQGEYTFRLNEATSSIDLLNEQYEQLVLVDYQTGELTNLLYTDYTFYSERTQSNSRFAIYAVPRQNAPTDLPNAIGSDEEVRKVIYNDHLYILRDGNVYNGMGQKM